MATEYKMFTQAEKNKIKTLNVIKNIYTVSSGTIILA